MQGSIKSGRREGGRVREEGEEGGGKGRNLNLFDILG